MNRLALIAATGFLSLALTACGEQNSKPTTTDSTKTTTQQTNPAPGPEQQPADTQNH